MRYWDTYTSLHQQAFTNSFTAYDVAITAISMPKYHSFE